MLPPTYIQFELGKNSMYTENMHHVRKTIILVFIFLVGCATSERSQTGSTFSTVRCGECFPYEKLPLNLQEKAKAVLLTLLDTQGLYTLVGDLKPYSEAELPAIPISEGEMRDLNHILVCDEVKIELFKRKLPFSHDNKSSAQEVKGTHVIRTDLVEQLIKDHPKDVQELGFHSSTPSPKQLLETVENHNPTVTEIDARWSGLLFGYPNYAIKFFEEDLRYRMIHGGSETGQMLKRKFVNIPVYSGKEGYFVYAVPESHKENSEDRQIKTRTNGILEEYKIRRARYLNKDKTNIFDLIREWYTGSDGTCSPKNTLK